MDESYDNILSDNTFRHVYNTVNTNTGIPVCAPTTPAFELAAPAVAGRLDLKDTLFGDGDGDRPIRAECCFSRILRSSPGSGEGMI